MIIPTEFDWAWLAGLFDGEGWITLGKWKFANTKNAYWTHQVGISNTHAPTMKRVKALADTLGIGTSLYPHHRKKPDGTKYQRACWKWTATARKAEVFLIQIYPYLVTKKEQAEIALAAIDILYRRPRPARIGRGGSAALYPGDDAAMQALKETLNELQLKEYTKADVTR